jgi:hypothetical protein
VATVAGASCPFGERYFTLEHEKELVLIDVFMPREIALEKRLIKTMGRSQPPQMEYPRRVTFHT